MREWKTREHKGKPFVMVNQFIQTITNGIHLICGVIAYLQSWLNKSHKRKITMSNFLENKTAMIDISEESPITIRIGFSRCFNPYEQQQIDDVAYYWTSCKAICAEDSDTVEWVAEDTIEIKADFDNGYFAGDLTHRDAITLGDSNFDIGLLKLFENGYKVKTKEGVGVEPATDMPVYIQFIYDETTIDIDSLKEQINYLRDDLTTMTLKYLEAIHR